MRCSFLSCRIGACAGDVLLPCGEHPRTGTVSRSCDMLPELRCVRLPAARHAASAARTTRQGRCCGVCIAGTNSTWSASTAGFSRPPTTRALLPALSATPPSTCSSHLHATHSSNCCMSTYVVMRCLPELCQHMQHLLRRPCCKQQCCHAQVCCQHLQHAVFRQPSHCTPRDLPRDVQVTRHWA